MSPTTSSLPEGTQTASAANQPREDVAGGPAADLQKEPTLSPESFERVFDSSFRFLTMVEPPHQSEVTTLTQLCERQRLPLLSSEEVICMEEGVHVTHEDEHKQVLLNRKKGVYLKCARNLKTFRDFLLKAMSMQAIAEKNGPQFLVGICPKKLCIVTSIAPRKRQTVQAPVTNKNKRPLEDEVEVRPPKKREQIVLQKERPAQVCPNKGACEDESKVKTIRPEGQGKTSQSQTAPAQPPMARITPKDKSEIFQDFFRRIDSLVFKDATVARRLTHQEAYGLTQICKDFHLPVLSRQQFHACMEENALPIGKGSQGMALLNKEKELVMKFADNIKGFRSFLLEAKIMELFVDYPSGFQRLVGLFPEKMCLVTKYAGKTLNVFVPSGRLKLEHRYSVMTQIGKTLAVLHRSGLAHNDIKMDNVCVKLTASGPQVTLIDFGLARKAGTAPRLQREWSEKLPYAPEICGANSSGVCGAESDAYSVSKLLHQLFGSKQLPQLLNNWYVKSQSQRPSERSNMTSLVQQLEVQKIADLRKQY